MDYNQYYNHQPQAPAMPNGGMQYNTMAAPPPGQPHPGAAAQYLPTFHHSQVQQPPMMVQQQLPPPMPQPNMPSQGLMSGAPAPSAAAPASAPQARKMSSSTVRNGLRYALVGVQQPQRARMCGFGDKDRRPITPPPCVRLMITDEATGEELNVEELSCDPAFFVLQVDLWSENADREANVVRASASSPAVSISSATTTSYPPPADRPIMPGHRLIGHTPEGHALFATNEYPMNPMAMAVPVAHYPQQYYHGMQNAPPPQTIYAAPPPNPNAILTRNLIGSLTVNAAKLKDPSGSVGYWFVLQDLSVRTEGMFRLRFSFIDISDPGRSGITRGRAPVLAWNYSDMFQVYSAKKFPGVIESTPLSKCFAAQGIKIPIRKDSKNEPGADDDDGDY